MKLPPLTKSLIALFASVLAIYFVVFGLIQHQRTFRGPWNVTFSTDAEGIPKLLVEHIHLQISEQIFFPEMKMDVTNLSQKMVFDDPTKTNAPFGEIVFQDLTFLPGTVTFNFSGHEVELLPRRLSVDKKEYLWKKGDVISVTGEGKFHRLKRK
ncbi:MAG: hypothetical protein ABJC04_03180 [Verrucomicrobiota bacterium]